MISWLPQNHKSDIIGGFKLSVSQRKTPITGMPNDLGISIWVFLASCEKNNAKTANKGLAKSIQKYGETV